MAWTAELARLVSAFPEAIQDGHLADELARRCLGIERVISVEFGMADDSYSRGHADPDALVSAVRADFQDLLNDEWRSQITSIEAVLQIALRADERSTSICSLGLSLDRWPPRRPRRAGPIRARLGCLIQPGP